MFSGCLTALATPFTSQNVLDIESLERLMSFQHRGGVDGFVACGSTGEAATLSDEEYQTVIRTVKSLAKNKPVIAGVNASSTARAVEIALLARDSGAESLLLVTPPYNKPSQNGIIAHFEAVKSASKLPVIAYNIPGRTGLAMTAATLASLSSQKIINGIKESSGSLDAQLDILIACESKVSMLAGDDSFVLALLACGASGVISACANVSPALFAELCHTWSEGKPSRAREIQLKLIPLIRMLFIETNPVPVKFLLHTMGIFSTPHVRLPLTELEKSNAEKFRTFLEQNSWATRLT